MRAQAFELEYAVNETALPLESVQLWYTQDEGRSWTEFGFDEDRQSPFHVQPPGEGIFGFFLILSNSTGASSASPRSGTPPQQTVVIDFTPPVVQLHPLRQTVQLGQTIVQVRWTAIDAQLTSRPVELSFRRPPSPAWLPANTVPLANTGRYDWRVPDGFTGALALRVTVSDAGGNRVDSEPQLLELSPASTVGAEATARLVGGDVADSDSAAVSGSKKARERATKLFTDALAHRERGEFTQGIARLREVLKLDPQRTEALSEMAGMLARIGDHDRSLSAYDLALRQRPNDRSSLVGAAAVYREKKDYPSAGDRLRTVLRYNPGDAEAWMSLGDIAVLQGDEVLARECYTRATNIDPQASQVIADARQRLAMMARTLPGEPRGSK